MRRSLLSILMTRAVTSWPTLRTFFILSTRSSLICEIWTRPSISCCNPINAPKLASDQIAHFVKLVDSGPRILGQLLQTNGDPLIGLVHFQDHRFHFVSLLQD